MCQYTDRIRSILVRSFGIQHTLPYGALIRLFTSSGFFLIPLEFLTFLCTCPFLCGSRFHCYEHPPCWYGPVHELINFDFSFFFLVSLVLVRVRDTLCDIHMEFCFAHVQFLCFVIFIYFSIFCKLPNFVYLSVVLCSQSCHLFD